MSFTKDLNRFVSNSKEKMSEVNKRASFRLATAIVIKSPVDTGRFRSNWIGAFGSPSDRVLKTGRSDPLKRLETYIGSRKFGSVFYFTNSLPYAVKLEYGYSQQAPNGMVRLSVRNWSRYVQEEIARLR